VLDVEAIVAEKLYAGSRKFCAIGHNTQVFAHHLTLAHIIPRLQKTPWDDGPHLVPFYRRWNIWCSFVDVLSRFEVKLCASNWRRSSKIEGFLSPIFLEVGEKFPEVGFQHV